MNIFAAFAQPIARAVVTACYAHALRNFAEAAQHINGLGPMLVVLSSIMTADINACAPPEPTERA